jgi:hypothetical protein
MRPNESVSLLRQMRRGMRQARMQGESEVVKTEKCALIDVEYFKKCILNEPVLSFESLERVLAQEEEENGYIHAELVEIERRLTRIEEDIG